MADNKPYRYLNALLVKNEYAENDFSAFLSSDSTVAKLAVEPAHDFDGVLYIKKSEEKRPRWTQLIDAIVGHEVGGLSNKSSSAVLLVRFGGNVIAFTFGYGRFLLNMSLFEQDFGLKTALNTLDHQSLRSVDLHTLEDQPIQKKSQAARGSEASVFGVDIFRDVLRAVTGSPRRGVNYKNISGGDAIFSFGLEMRVEDIPQIAANLHAHYQLELYKESFSWVDNIRRLKDSKSIFELDDALLKAIKEKDADLVITLPEIVDWDSVLGFSFTRSKREISSTIDTKKYLDSVDRDSVSIDSIKRDRIYVTDVHDNEFGRSVYSCLYFELDSALTKKVIFGGVWYEIDKSFMRGIDASLALIQLSDINFPGVETWEEGGKEKIETEGGYNERAAVHLKFHLLDKRLVKCSKTTSPIELCDLLSPDKQFVHVKHRKGGSAGLSHLFAQGGVSAEVMLGDKEFRREARRVLRKVHNRACDLVPLDNLRSADYEIIFLILGDTSEDVKENLPFFSKVNLVRACESISQRGFKVRVAGAEKIMRRGH